MQVSLRSLTLAAFSLALATASYAAVPNLISYQGRLTTPAGAPVPDGGYAVVFTIYDASTGGTSKWTETQTVTTKGGLFTVQLGSVSPLVDTVFNAATRYLGLKAGTDPELAPRTAILSVPFALRTASVNGASGGAITTNLAIGPSSASSSPASFAAGASAMANGIASIALGSNCFAWGDHSAVIGGENNSASGAYSFSAGHGAFADHAGCFVWSSDPEQINSTAPKQFLIRAAGGVGIGTNTPHNQLTVAGSADLSGSLAVGVASPAARLDILGGNWNVAGGEGDFRIGTADYRLKIGVAADGGGAGHCRIYAAGGMATLTLGSGTNDVLNVSGTNVGIGTINPAAGLHVKGAGYPRSFGYFDTDASGQDAGLRFYEAGVAKSHVFHETSTNTLALYGEGYAGISVTSSGSVGIGTATPSQKLDVAGNICYSGSIGGCSDARYKRDVMTLDGSLDKLMQLRGVSYHWNRRDYPDRNFDDRAHIGVIAQELERLYPELVLTDSAGYKTVDYGRLTPVLVEALKAQQKEIEVQQEQIANQHRELASQGAVIDELRARLEILEALHARAAARDK